MKNKNLLVGVGVAILLYFIFKSKKGKQVTEKVKETVMPKSKGKEIYSGVKQGDTSSRANNLQIVFLNVPKYFPIPTKGGSIKYFQQNDKYEIENSKGERKKILGANPEYIVLDVRMKDSGQGAWLQKGEPFKIFKL